ncbi:sialate O-acetylesterase [Tundrisphaera sp. TA3]|uniref:sialate O-acetylesterase n=1 Tax=Tundrisphaera sp. TA3 TaxID=3435775 RepID=UPI003EBB71EC
MNARVIAGWGMAVVISLKIGGPSRAQQPPGAARAVTLGAIFGDRMVIQRDRPIRVWGEAAPGSVVAVRVGPREGGATAGDDGRWEAVLDPLPAGGPHAVRASVGGATAEAADVLVGDVWIASGQSNMQMNLKDCDGGPAAAEALAKIPRLRLASVGRKASASPETRADIRWNGATPEVSLGFSGVAAFFAASLQADPALDGVPLGIIDSSFGGSACEAWVPREALAGFDPKDLKMSMFGAGPSGFYNAMIAPLGRAPIRGVVWYQGESNADRPGLYPRLLGALIGSWRERFDTPDLPFVVVQLPDWAPGSAGYSWAWLREAQAEAVRATPHASLAVGLHTTDGFDLHPREKAEIGRRAALCALRDAYGRPVVAGGPAFKAARPDGNALRVEFAATGGLVARGGDPVRGFAVAGADGRYAYADAAIDGASVILRSGEVPEPRTVRYAWAGVPDANLSDASGLPAAPFRTDALAPPDVDVQPKPRARQVRMKAYEATVEGNGSVTSLGVGGKQFLSNALGGSGGTSVPGWLGPRELATICEPGPGRVECSDGEVVVLLEFAEAGMEWTIANRTANSIKFRIALTPQVAVAGELGSGPLTLSRGPAALVVDGVESVNKTDEGPVLERSVAGRSSQKLTLRVVDPSKHP